MKQSVRVSLWLLPPMAVREPLRAQIADLSRKYGGSVPFEPHITVLGGVECDSYDQALEYGRVLATNLKGKGTIPCRFQKQVVSMLKRENENEFVWNQASVAVMESSKEFVELVESAADLIGIDSSVHSFAPPVCQPHLSFFYGTKNAPPPKEVTPPADFDADEVALWLTSPGGTAGVKEWKQLISFTL